MPTATHDLIASNVLGTNTTSVSFTSITSTYRDLVLVISGLSTADFNFVQARFNGDTGSNYFNLYLSGNGAGKSSTTAQETKFYLAYDVWFTSGSRNALIMDILDYSATNKHKLALVRNNRASRGVEANHLRWASTSALTSMEIFSSSGTSFASGTSFYLYGIVS